MAMRDFWYNIPLVCDCGKKVVMCGFCQECLDTGGKEKILKEAKKIKADKNKYDKLIKEDKYSEIKKFFKFEMR